MNRGRFHSLLGCWPLALLLLTPRIGEHRFDLLEPEPPDHPSGGAIARKPNHVVQVFDVSWGLEQGAVLNFGVSIVADETHGET